MTFPVINSIITDQIIKALCNTLVHSLWQGLLLAAIAGLIVIFTKRASSALRYNLLITALLFFAIGSAVTFIMQLQQVHFTGASQVSNVVQNNPAVIQPYQSHAIVQPGNFTSMVSGYLNTYHNSIVLIWFLIICAKSIQLCVGLYGTYQLRRVNVIGVKGFWDERIKQLACLLGIRQSITMLESGLAKVPMVIGHLKPIVLIPIGLLTALSAEEVEAILVHEIAHVKRRDYLVNMLQSLMEIVFFFNPAVLWISQLIKTERENCCDDIALSQSTNKVNYIRALVSCEEYQAAVPAYAMAFPGSKNSLLDRVKRLASNRNHSLNLFEKTLLAVCLVVSGLCVSAFAEKDNIKRTVKNVVKIFQHDTLNDEQKQQLTGQTALLQQQTANVRANTALLNVSQPGLEVAQDTNQSKPNVLTGPLNLTTNVALSPINVSLGALNGSLGSLGGSDTVKKKVRTKVEIRDSVNVNVNTNVSADVKTNVTTNVNMAYSNTYSSGYGLSAHSPSTTYSNSNYNSSGYHVSPSPKYSKSDSNRRLPRFSKPSIVPRVPRIPGAPPLQGIDLPGELLKAHLITEKDKNTFSAHLDNNELIINGVKQSEENHQLILKKFMRKPEDNVNLYYRYSSQNSSSHSNYPPQGDYKNNNYNKRPDIQQAKAREKAAQAEIIADLQKDGLITNRNHLSFTISDKEFTLNGKKQSDEVFNKYKKKYVPENAGNNWTWSHSYNNDDKPE